MKKKTLHEWKVESSTTPLGDTGDYMNSLWMTNGEIILITDDETEEDELQELCDILNSHNQQKNISSNLPIIGSLKFCEDDLRKAFEDAKKGGIERVPVVIDQYGGVNIEEHFVANLYKTFDDWYNQNKKLNSG